ncbi:MAG: hypothetical protein Tsb0020_26100 [Haliangiales bacterium]
MQKDKKQPNIDQSTPNEEPEVLTSEELELITGGFDVQSTDLISNNAFDRDIIVCVSGC